MEFLKLSRPNRIEMTRGDSEVYDVGIIVNGEPYTPVDGDEIRFVMRRPDMDFSRTRYLYAPVMEKRVPISTMQIVFTPEDTKGLPFGRYDYDMQITFADGRVKTFVKASPFILTREED